MNNLFSNSFSRLRKDESEPDEHRIQMISFSPTDDGNGVTLDRFFEDVESINEELKEIGNIYKQLHDSNEQIKTLHTAKSVKEIQNRMDSDVMLALKKVKLIKIRIEALDRSNAANRSLPGCGPGSSSDRTRTSIVGGLRKKLEDAMNSFNALREQISSGYRETVQRRFFAVKDEYPDEKTLDLLITSGESETFLQKAISEQGRGTVADTISEIQERHQGVKEMEKNLTELHRVFLDMAVLVDVQGEQIDGIESNVGRAKSFVRDGSESLETAKVYQKNTRKWICYAVIVMLVIALLVVLYILSPWESNGSTKVRGRRYR